MSDIEKVKTVNPGESPLNQDGFEGVDPIYQNFANRTDKPLKGSKAKGESKGKGDAPKGDDTKGDDTKGDAPKGDDTKGGEGPKAPESPKK